jgi:hypothetical protein
MIKESTMRKISDTSDIKQGDILRDPVANALFEVLKVDFGMALLEIKTKSSQICASPHEEFEEWFTNPGDKFWVYLDYEYACEWFQTDTQIRVWALYLKDMLVVEPDVLTEPKIRAASLTGSKLELELSGGGKISTIIPKLVLPNPKDLRKIRDKGEEALLDSCIQKIVEQNSEGKTSLKMEYAELLTLKSKLEESGYLVDLADCEISW